MKRLSLFLSLLLTLTGAYAVEFTDISKLDYAVYFEPTKGQIGNYVDIYIRTKTQMVSTGYGFDIVMPDGISVAEHESLRKCDFASYTGGKPEKSTDNRYRFIYVISSNSNMLNAKTDTLTQRVRLKIDSSVKPGDYAIQIAETEIVSETGAAGTMKRPADIYCKLTLQYAPVVNATTTTLDLRDMEGEFGMVDVSANPNVIIYANEGQVENEENVVVEGECETLRLYDKFPFNVTESFHVGYASYEREDINGPSTLYLPFGFKPSAFNAYTCDSEADGIIYFKQKTTNIAAYTPLVICPKEGESSAKVFIEKEDFDISTSTEKTVAKNGYSFSGVLSTKVLRGSDGCFVFSAKDCKFKKCNDAGTTIRAFRCYVQAPSNVTAKSELGFLVDGLSTGISTLNSNLSNSPSGAGGAYTLNGQKVISPKTNEIYIINGKKAIFK